MIRMFGIKNCDTVKKAQKWFQQNQIAFDFVDFRNDGISIEQIQAWLSELGADTLINKRSTTYRNLDEQQKQALTDDTAALLSTLPTLIKRPVLEHAAGTMVGFNATQYQTTFAGNAE